MARRLSIRTSSDNTKRAFLNKLMIDLTQLESSANFNKDAELATESSIKRMLLRSLKGENTVFRSIIHTSSVFYYYKPRISTWKLLWIISQKAGDRFS